MRGFQNLHGDDDNMQRGGGGRDREAAYDSGDGVAGFKGLSRGYDVTAAKVPHEKFGRGQRSGPRGSGQ